MALVQPDGIFRRLAQILGIGTVVHDAVMHVRPPRVVGRPPDNRQVTLANSRSGPLVISTRSAFLAGGSTWAAVGWNASRLPTMVVIESVRSSAFMDVLVPGGR